MTHTKNPATRTTLHETKNKRTRTTMRVPPLARGSGLRPGHYIVKAWAIVNDETGRVMLIEVGSNDTAGLHRMESPAIYMTKRAAYHHKRDDERLVRVAIREVNL